MLLKDRIKEHLKSSKRDNLSSYFHKVIKKYGPDTLSWSSLCTCLTKEQAIEQEIFYIWYYNTKAPNGYNLTSGGEGLFDYSHTEKSKRIMSIKSSGRKHTEETKRIMSENHTGVKNPFYGRKHSEETKKIMCEKQRGENNPHYGKKHSEKAKEKMCNAKKKKREYDK